MKNFSYSAIIDALQHVKEFVDSDGENGYTRIDAHLKLLFEAAEGFVKQPIPSDEELYAQCFQSAARIHGGLVSKSEGPPMSSTIKDYADELYVKLKSSINKDLVRLNNLTK